jgi:serpin B
MPLALHGASATRFSEELTHSGTFYTADDRQASVQYVSADRNFSTAQQQDFKLVDIPFRDSTYSLSFVQPAVSGQADWILQLESSDLKERWSGLSYDRAIVTFPKLDLEFDKELIDPMQRMGMTKAFSEFEADFSNIGSCIDWPGDLHQ